MIFWQQGNETIGDNKEEEKDELGVQNEMENQGIVQHEKDREQEENEGTVQDEKDKEQEENHGTVQEEKDKE